MTDLSDIPITSQEVIADIYPFYEQLRVKGGILWSRHHKAWLISKYSYVKSVLMDSSASVEKLSPFMARSTGDIRSKMETLHEIMRHWIPFLDPPAHTRLRKILQKGFMPRTVLSHEQMIRSITVEILDSFKDRDRIEFLQDFAYQLPALVVTELFGLARDQVDQIKIWSDGICKFVLGSPEPDRYEVTATMAREMHAYLSALVTSRFQAITIGGVEPTETLLDKLLLGKLEPDGLTDEEIVSTLILILFAAPETTANMLMNIVLTLAHDKPTLAALRADPSLISVAIEELLRFDGPVPTIVRVCKSDITIGNERIKAGDRIFLLLQSANRDPEQFSTADGLDFGRGRCPHLGFGYGTHLCLGAPLARLEGKVALEELLKRYEDFKILDDRLEWREELISHAPKAMHIGLTRAKVPAL